MEPVLNAFLLPVLLCCLVVLGVTTLPEASACADCICGLDRRFVRRVRTKIYRWNRRFLSVSCQKDPEKATQSVAARYRIWRGCQR